ncbi:MAG: hypothetical protein GF310_02010, partial [candidate division Zixibacteria bacterium]|nr:hypothetical protein [candidate division Zixibacteria bacterium]
MMMTFDADIFEEDDSVLEDYRNRLRENSRLRDVIPDKSGTFEVTTELQEETRAWTFRSYVTLNGKSLDAVLFPPQQHSFGKTDTDDEVPLAVVNQAAQAHLEQKQQLQELLNRRRKKRQARLKRWALG